MSEPEQVDAAAIDKAGAVNELWAKVRAMEEEVAYLTLELKEMDAELVVMSKGEA